MQNDTKTVLITGASSGIGLELAKLFAQDHYQIYIVGRNQTKLDETAAILQNSGSPAVKTFVYDLTEPDAPQLLYNELQSQSLVPEILVNDAGQGAYGLFVENDLRDELQIIQLNISALVSLSKYVARDMVKRGRGRILNLASIASKTPGPWQAVYHGTKAFVHSFTEAIRYELKDSGVSVTSLLPGATNTNFFKNAGMEESKIVQEGELADPAQVAKDGYTALMNGQDMVVSGFKNKMTVAMGNITPDETQAAMLAKQQEPATHG